MSHITKEQRYTIEVLLARGEKQNFIAKAIGKCKSVVSREISRNKDKRNGKYKADLAQRKTQERHSSKPKKTRFTDEVKDTVDKHLEEDFSPEQISGYCKKNNIECVSHERIYQYIWQDKQQGGDRYTHLRRRSKRYRKRGNLKDSRGIIKDKVSIDERPEIVEQKKRFGDLEIDTIIGKNKKGAILTINDRVTGKIWIQKLAGKSAKPLAEKTVEALHDIKDLIHTITADNGKEFAEHKTIAEQLGIDFFFAHPYHSWERGANENNNGLIRQYIPKKTDFDNITEQQIREVQNKLNNRPRKRLDYFSPNQIFNKLVKSINNQKVALVT